MTLDVVRIKLDRRASFGRCRARLNALAAILVRAFLRQAVSNGFFHADSPVHLFALPDAGWLRSTSDHGRIDRHARLCLAEILYGLITGITGASPRSISKRICAAHTTSASSHPGFARRRADPLPAGRTYLSPNAHGLFAITRDFDMPTQPHLLLLQKRWYGGGAPRALDPDINMGNS